MFGAIVGAVIGIASFVGSAILNAKNHELSDRQVNLQEDAFEYQKEYDANQTQIRVDDYSKAGLNPILAAGGAGSSVGSVSATPVQPNFQGSNAFDKLSDVLNQTKQLKQQKEIADNNNETAKEVAETQAASDKYVADKNNETARINANLNAQTQTQIATDNNEALKELRSAQARAFGSMANKQDWQNSWNEVFHHYDGPLSSPYSLVDNYTNQLTESGKEFFKSIFGSMKEKIPSDKIGEFKNWFVDKIKSLKGVDLSEVDWLD